jgi:hypothetical protein
LKQQSVIENPYGRQPHSIMAILIREEELQVQDAYPAAVFRQHAKAATFQQVIPVKQGKHKRQPRLPFSHQGWAELITGYFIIRKTSLQL